MSESDLKSTNNSFTTGDYVWFVGEVTDVNDPDKDGRVRVKIYGYHPDAEGAMSVNDMPWAMVELSPSGSSHKGLGFSPHGLVVGATVKGHFLDGNDAQLPMVTGTFFGYGEVNDLAKGTNKIKKTLVSGGGIQEPKSPYNSKYPHNKVYETTSGHTIEIDDTPNNERIHLYHKSGTFIEIHPNGQTVIHTKSDMYTINEGNTYHITKGNYKHFVTGNYNTEVGGSYTNKVSGSGNMQFGSSLNIKCGSTANIQSGSSMNIKAGGNMKLKAPKINLN